MVRGHVLYCGLGMGDDYGLVVGDSCAVKYVMKASLVLSYFEIIVGMVFGRDGLFAALCLG